MLLLIFPQTCLAPPFAPGKKIKRLRCGIKKARDNAGLLVGRERVAYHFTSAGSLPPLAASFAITCLCSQMFMLAESLLSPV